jgi:manganese/zinc/iron transport system permease protein
MFWMDTLWILLTGSAVAASCGLLGAFLVLRKSSMLGDAISHAILPGIVIAFWLTQSRASLPMFLGAALVGGLTAVLIQWLSRNGVQGDASIGVIFTSLFALGVVLVSLYGSSVDLDLDCVLYGEIAYTPFDQLEWGQTLLGPRALWINGILLLVNILFVLAFYKELKVTSFDPAMAAAVGIPVALIHYSLVGLVAVTSVGAFESVGAILVVAMLIVPGATAYLLTDKLQKMLFLSMLAGVLSAVGGYSLATWLDASIAGCMGAVSGGFFLSAFLISPRYGVLSRFIRQWRLRRKVAEEDVLLWAGRRMELQPQTADFSPRDLAAGRKKWNARDAQSFLRLLTNKGLFRFDGNGVFQLTAKGRRLANELLRRHRLYETYLDELGYSAREVHGPADRVEHYLTAEMTREVEEQTGSPEVDPHGKPIPERV